MTDKLAESIDWFQEWVDGHTKTKSALEAEDYDDMYKVLEAARAYNDLSVVDVIDGSPASILRARHPNGLRWK